MKAPDNQEPGGRVDATFLHWPFFGDTHVHGPEGTRDMVEHVMEAWQQDIHMRLYGLEPRTNTYLLFPYEVTADGARLYAQAEMAEHMGDVIRGGDRIAAVGNTGGHQDSGLYFEMRHEGRPFDPMTWVSVR